jgi:murein lipoprotein
MFAGNCAAATVFERMTHVKKKGSRAMPITSKRLATVATVVLGGLSLSACATTDYVDEQIATVNQRVDALDSRLQQTTTTANSAAAQAQAAATDAQNANRRLDQLTARVDRLEQQATAQRRPRN